MNCKNGMKSYISMQPERRGCNGTTIRTSEWEQVYSIKPDEKPVRSISEYHTYDRANYMPYGVTEMLPGYAYTPGFLRSNIGSLLRVEFLIGGGITERVGILREVGVNYIVLDVPDYGSKMMCDLCSIKFVTVLKSPDVKTAPDYFSE